MKPDVTVPETTIKRRRRCRLWLRHFAMLAMWGADEGGRDPVETERINLAKYALDENWWLVTTSFVRDRDLTNEDLGTLVREMHDKYMLEHEKLLERERHNRPPVEGVHYSTT